MSEKWETATGSELERYWLPRLEPFRYAHTASEKLSLRGSKRYFQQMFNLFSSHCRHLHFIVDVFTGDSSLKMLFVIKTHVFEDSLFMGFLLKTQKINITFTIFEGFKQWQINNFAKFIC